MQSHAPPRSRKRRLLKSAFSLLPQDARSGLYRNLVKCDASPDPRLQLRVADNRDDLEACFRLLHDAYVASGFMKPHPSGLRVTPWHALPTTTTLAAYWDGRVVGTLSLIREGVFGFPLQSAFDLSGVRSAGGQIAEASALAVHPRFRRAGGAILFPLMKFMYEYCTRFFDTRHLVIAVNPAHIEMYESLLLFRRMQASVIENYDFVNGAPAVGATLDLGMAPERYASVYGKRAPGKNLHHYFVELDLANITWPDRHYYTTNDPVMTPDLLDYFFNRRTQVMATLDPRQRALLHSIYPGSDYAAVLPPLAGDDAPAQPLRRHPRYSIKCPGTLDVAGAEHPVTIFEMSLHGFQARGAGPLPDGVRADLQAHLGEGLESRISAVQVHCKVSEDGEHHYHGFFLESPDEAWIRCANALEQGRTFAELRQLSA